MESIEQKIAAVSEKHKADQWTARQEAARQQQADSERQRVERYRTNRIAAIKAQLAGIPGRIKGASAMAAEGGRLPA